MGLQLDMGNTAATSVTGLNDDIAGLRIFDVWVWRMMKVIKRSFKRLQGQSSRGINELVRHACGEAIRPTKSLML